MIITVDLHGNIYNQLATESESKGLTIEEFIRMILGDHVAFMNPRPLIPIPSLPIQNTLDKFSKIIKLVVNEMVASGVFKCPTCTLTLTSEALEKGECNNCGAKL